jgi:hypothetical protein
MFDWLSTKIDNLWAAFVAFFFALWEDFYNFITEFPAVVLESFLNAISSLFSALSPPDFLANGLSGLVDGLDSSVLYFLNETGFFQGLVIYGSGFTFRILRKIFTLGQW